MLHTPDAPTPPTPNKPARSRLSRALGAIGLADTTPGGPIAPKVQQRIDKTRATLPKGAQALFRKDGSLISHALVGDAIRGALSDKIDLSDALLLRADLRQRSFTRITLKRADLRRARLSYARLLHTDLGHADLREINAERMRVKNSHLCHSDFSGSTLFMGEFKDTRLRDTKWVKAKLTGTDFSGCNLTLADFTNARFRKRVVDTYRGYRTYKVNFRDADLTGARFSINARFREMDLRGAKLDGVMLVDAQGNDMPNAQLRENGSIINHRDASWRGKAAPATKTDKDARPPEPR